jgi:plasmid stabilization system protein ParE
MSLQDLEEIGDYIALTLENPIAARNTLRKIQSRIDKLAKLPNIGMRLPSPLHMKSEYRMLVCGSYLAFFHSDESTIYIDRILYGRRDYLSILFPSLTGEDKGGNLPS